MPHNFLFSGRARKTGRAFGVFNSSLAGRVRPKNHHHSPTTQVLTRILLSFIFFFTSYVTIIVFSFRIHQSPSFGFIDIVMLLPGNKRFLRKPHFPFPGHLKTGSDGKEKTKRSLPFAFIFRMRK